MRPPIALTIAGTDPSGGAGIQADLKSFSAFDVYGTSVVTALVAQNTHGVREVYDVDTQFVGHQLDSVTDDLVIDATKTGMLARAELVELAAARAPQLGFLVVDPVMVSTSGHRLLDPQALKAVRTRLLPVSGLITPNLPEAALLLGEDRAEAASPQEMRDQAAELLDLGASAVLLKGGHGHDATVTDLLVWVDSHGAVSSEVFEHSRVNTPHTHGTGCTLSAAITAGMANRLNAGEPASAALPDSVEQGLEYLAAAIASGAAWQLARDQNGSHGPVDHSVRTLA